MVTVKLNEENCIDALRVAEKKFQNSKAPKEFKLLAKLIDPIVFITHRKASKFLAGAFGRSIRARKDPLRKKLNIHEDTHTSTLIGTRRYFLFIEIYSNSFNKSQRVDKKYLQKIMGHELAHIYQIVIYRQTWGSWTSSDDETDHDADWQKLSRWCGGNTSPIIDK